MDSSVYRSALFFVAVFLVNIHTSQCLLNNLLGGRPSSTTVTNKREQSKPIQTRDPLGNVESLTGDLTNGNLLPNLGAVSGGLTNKNPLNKVGELTNGNQSTK